jgi:uncharacterized protein
MNVLLRPEPEAGTPRRWLPQGLSFATDLGPHVYLANGSRVYAVTESFAREYDALVAQRDAAGVDALLVRHGLDAPAYIDDQPVKPFAMHAISLAVAQKCNLGCTYCYAQGGEFGGPAKNMPEATALQAVERLIEGVEPGERVNIAFLGGEPLVNRPVLRAATEHAAALGIARGVPVGFSITTNGTLLKPDDGDFFERHGFAVTISLDGVGAVHDGQRPFKGGRGSYERILANVTPLLVQQQAMQVSARVTVTPKNLRLPETLEHFIDLGFHSVGFSPMLKAPSGRGEMSAPELAEMLAQMIACGRAFETNVTAGRRYPFLNMVTALKELHKGTHRPYPCGAGAGYLAVSADGGLFACHRFVDDDAGAMGNLADGPDAAVRADWLAKRHVHFQSPCSGCWARYLCGGGCHHEVIHRGRPACDYIRGWLEYCLGAYVRLLDSAPAFFGSGGGQPSGQQARNG